MSVSAHDVAAVIREQLPDAGVVTVHKLLYYCQGHHLATFGTPLFTETISAWNNGPVVGTLWKEEKDNGVKPSSRQLGEAELNTIGYVISRYGALSPNDLIHLTHGEKPWQTADAIRRSGESVTIRVEWIREYFASAEVDDDENGPLLDSEAVTAWLQDASQRRTTHRTPDDLDAFRERLTINA